MTEALLLHADSETDSNLLYATGFVVPDPLFWFKTRGRSYLVVNALELGRARAQARVDTGIDRGVEREKLVRAGNSPPTQFEILGSTLRAKGVDAPRVPETFPLHPAAP